MRTIAVSDELLIQAAMAFANGPLQVVVNTNMHATIVDSRNRPIATCSWSTDAAKRADVICTLLNKLLYGDNDGTPSIPAEIGK